MKNVKDYTDEELIARILDVEAVKTVVYKRGYYTANGWREKEMDDLWVTGEAYRATASFGKNTGWYVGMDNIRAYYIDKHQADLKEQLRKIHAFNPAVADIPENLGTGYLANIPATTGLVEVAEDGKTAKALFYAIGHETIPNGDGTAEATWIPEKLAYDLVKEDGRWRIWHVVEAVDCECRAGTNFEDSDPVVDYSKDPVLMEFGEPTVPCLIHDATFNWWDDYPSRPMPYATWSDDISYGPEGYHPYEFFSWKGGEGKFAPTPEMKEKEA